MSTILNANGQPAAAAVEKPDEVLTFVWALTCTACHQPVHELPIIRMTRLEATALSQSLMPPRFACGCLQGRPARRLAMALLEVKLGATAPGAVPGAPSPVEVTPS